MNEYTAKFFKHDPNIFNQEDKNIQSLLCNSPSVFMTSEIQIEEIRYEEKQTKQDKCNCENGSWNHRPCFLHNTSFRGFCHYPRELLTLYVIYPIMGPNHTNEHKRN